MPKKVLQPHKGIYCTSCKHLIHKKCCTFNRHDTRLERVCSSCTSEIFPFSDMSDDELIRINFNSNDQFLCGTKPPNSGYQGYLGITGTTTNDGCGFYINEDLNYIERKDLNFKFKESGEECESIWIELLNLKKPNTVIGTIYCHPTKTNTIFINTLKNTLYKIHYTKYTIQNTLYKIHYTKYTIQNTLYKIHYTKYTIQNTLYKIHYTKYTIQNTLYKTHYTKYTMQNTLYKIHYTKYTIQNTLYKIHYTKYTIQNTLYKIKKEKKTVMISGDFNLLHYDKKEMVTNFHNVMLTNNLQTCITEPTRIINNCIHSLVDNIFINTLDTIHSGNILENISYDHLPNFLILESELLKQTKKSITVRDTKTFDQDEFTRELYHLNLCEHIELAENANTAYNIFHKRFLSLLNKHAPYKSLTKREINISQKPWLTKGILTSINIKRKLFKTYKNTNQNEIYTRYKKYRDLLNSLIRKSKKSHYKVYFEKILEIPKRRGPKAKPTK